MLREEKNNNFVFSPFSLHVTLAMLTSSSTDNSTTQNELLKALGRAQNIQTLSASYKDLLEEYEVIMNLQKQKSSIHSISGNDTVLMLKFINLHFRKTTI